MITPSSKFHEARRRTSLVFSLSVIAVFASRGWGAVDLQQFTPDPHIIGYSVYTTGDNSGLPAISLPPNSGLASGGLFGSTGSISLSDGMKLRAPLITTIKNFTLGGNSDSVPNLIVEGNLTVGAGTSFRGPLQVSGNFTSASPNISIQDSAAIKGNLALNGGTSTVTSFLQLGGAYSSTGVTFTPTAQVKMAAAGGGPAIPASQIAYNQPYSPIYPQPLTNIAATNLPAHPYTVTGYSPVLPLADINLSTPSLAGDAPVQFYSGKLPNGGFALQTGAYAKCPVPVSANYPKPCNGDTLLPGYYGNLTLTGNGRALLLTEGFYSFKSIELKASNAIVAAQPNGGRTVVYALNGVTSSSSHAFIGPDGARLATGFGSGPNQFLGGTMMLASGANINTSSDISLWATLSAPLGVIHFFSQVTLYGQAFAQRLYGDNGIDFGEGAFIPFRGLVPALIGPTFSVGEKSDPTCVDPSGRPCRDTLVTVRIPFVTPYKVKAKYRLVESATRSAIGGVDFPMSTDSLAIEIGDSTAQLKVRIFDDSSYEGPETFRIQFSDIFAAGCPDSLGNADTTIKTCYINGTIVDDDRAPLVKILADSAVREGNSGTHPLTFTVRLFDPAHPTDTLSAKNAPQLPVAFKWRTADATATLSDNDYVAQAPKWDTIPALGLAKSVSVLVNGDVRYEYDDYFLGVVDSARNGSIVGTASDSGILLNDDAIPSISIAPISVQEPAVYGDTAWASFSLRLSAPSGVPTTAFWRSADSSAKGTANFASQPLDFLKLSGSTVIAPDSLVRVVRVPVFGDTLFEKSELFMLAVDSFSNAVAGTVPGIATIQDADSAPAVFVSDTTIREPSTGTSVVRFHVRLARPSGLPSSFIWSTRNGTALQGVDYVGVVADTMRIPAFVRDTFLQVTILSDSVAGEGTETFSVDLSNLLDLRAGRVSAVGNILDAQDGFRLTIDSIAPVAETDSTLRFIAHTDWIPAFPIRLNYRTLDGSALAGYRYVSASGVATLAAGSRSTAISVKITRDTLWEPQQFFSLRLDSIKGANAPVATDSVARAWIYEGSDLVFDFDTPDTSVREDLAGTVPATIRLSQPASIPVKIRLPLLGSSTATLGADFSYKGLSGDTLTIPAGKRTWTFGIPVVPDTIIEPDEIASFGISPITTGVPGARAQWNLTILDDDSLLKVEILNPPDKIHTKEDVWAIKWTIDDKPQPTSDTLFPVQGWNCVERHATDRFGRVFSDTNCIWLDTTPPKVTVFKITGPNPHNHDLDTTWWGDLAKTRFGKDTVWYETRDSILNSDGKAWSVIVDTLFALTDFRGDGLYPTRVSYCDSVGNCGFDTGWIDLKQTLPKAVGGYYLDQNHDGRVDAMVVELSGAWNADFLPTFDAPLPPESRKGLALDSSKPFVTISGSKDYTRFIVPIVEPFRYGATSFDSIQGVMWESWTNGNANPDSFPIRDSVAPVIVKSEIHRVENYKDPDTLFVTPSEPLASIGNRSFQIGSCPDDRDSCENSELEWNTVPAKSMVRLTDGRYKILVPPGADGSVRPGYQLRFQTGVSDSSGNVSELSKIQWTSVVEGEPRPDLVQVSVETPRADIPKSEAERSAPGGILIRATKGNMAGDSVNRQWWEPGRGYVDSYDPTVRAICPEDGKFCNGPTLYINRPVRMIIYIYDNSGTFVMNRTVDITQADIERMNPDQIDRLSIQLEWNHRTTQNRMVSGGVYVWRIVSYVKVDGLSSPVIENRLFKLGVNRLP